MYNLFLDDKRNPQDVFWVKLPAVPWVVVRSFDVFVRIVLERGVPEIVSFDHDIAPEHEEYACARYIPYDKLTEKTGCHAARWLYAYCSKSGKPLPTCFIHTLNGAGRANIEAVLSGSRIIC
jgi:hypothetical protein